MNRADIFRALNEDYPTVRTEVSSNPIGLFETDDRPTPTLDMATPIATPILEVTSITEPTLDNSSE